MFVGPDHPMFNNPLGLGRRGRGPGGMGPWGGDGYLPPMGAPPGARLASCCILNVWILSCKLGSTRLLRDPLDLLDLVVLAARRLYQETPITMSLCHLEGYASSPNPKTTN